LEEVARDDSNMEEGDGGDVYNDMVEG